VLYLTQVLKMVDILMLSNVGTRLDEVCQDSIWIENENHRHHTLARSPSQKIFHFLSIFKFFLETRQLFFGFISYVTQTRVCLNYKDWWWWYMIKLRRYSCKMRVFFFSDVSQNRKVRNNLEKPSDGGLTVPLEHKWRG